MMIRGATAAMILAVTLSACNDDGADGGDGGDVEQATGTAARRGRD